MRCVLRSLLVRSALAILVLGATGTIVSPALGRNPSVSRWATNLSGSEPAGETALTDSRPQIVVEGTTVHALWRNMSPQSVYSLYYARSLDGGRTFEERRLIDSDMAGDHAYQADLEVEGNTVHVAAIRKTSHELVYYRSLDGGATFDPAKVVATNPQSMRLAASAAGVSIAYDNAGVHVASSADNGGTFATVTVPTSGEPVASPLADLVRDGDGIYLLYVADDNAPYQSHTWLYFVASQDGGATFPTKHLLTQPASDGLFYSNWYMDDTYGSSLPNLAVDGDRLHVVWSQRTVAGSGSPLYLFYNRSTDRGNSFGTPVGLDEGTMPAGWAVIPGHESVVASGDHVYVAYAEKYYDSGLFVRASQDGGETFAAPFQVSAPQAVPYVGGGSIPLMQLDNSDPSGASLHVFWDCAGYARTEDGGQSFSYPTLLGPVFAWSSCGMPQVAGDANGALHTVLQGVTRAYNYGAGWGLNDSDIMYFRRDPQPPLVGASRALALAQDTSIDRWDGMVLPGGPDLAFSTAMTAEAWIRPDLPMGVAEFLIMREGAGAFSYLLGQDAAGTPIAGIRTSDGEFWVGGTQAALNGVWTHVAVTYDATAGADNLRLYVGGALVGTSTATGAMLDDRGMVLVGSNPSRSNNTWIGEVDELRFWNRALTAGDIQTQMNATLSGNESGLVAYYGFDETPRDLTGRGNDGVLTSQEEYVAGLQAKALQVGLSVARRYYPGRTGTLLLSYANTLPETASDTIATLALPGSFAYTAGSSGGNVRLDGNSPVAYWKLGDVPSGKQGVLALEVDVPAGYEERDEHVTAAIAAAEATIPELDLASYESHAPLELTEDTPLSDAALDAAIDALPSAREMLTYAQSAGYMHFGLGRRSVVNGTAILRVFLLSADGASPAVLFAFGDGAYVEEYGGDRVRRFDRDGEMTVDNSTGTFSSAGTWAESHSLTYARCVFHCAINAIPEHVLNAATQGLSGAATSGIACVKCKANPDVNSSDCRSCARAVAEAAASRVRSIPMLGYAVDVRMCQLECSNNPNAHVCIKSMWTCDKGWKGDTYRYVGKDLRIEYPCNALGMYEAPRWHGCDFNYRCVEGQEDCEKLPDPNDPPPPQTKRGKFHIGPAHDPNALYVEPMGDVVPGQLLSYTIEYENLGSGPAFDVFILDTLDENLDDTTLVVQDGGTYDSASRILSWEVGEVGPAQGGMVHFQVAVRDDLTSGSAVTNVATVYFPSALEETPTNPTANFVRDVAATSQVLQVVAGESVDVELTGSAVGGGSVSFEVTQTPTFGTISGTAPHLTYTPDLSYSGQDSLWFAVKQGAKVSPEAPVYFEITASPNDTTGPAVVLTSPRADETGVPPSRELAGDDWYLPILTAQLDGPVDPSTVEDDALFVDGIPGRTRYDSVKHAISFLPMAPLVPATTYVATVRGDLQDPSGNAMGADHVWQFRTAAAKSLRVSLMPGATSLAFEDTEVGATSKTQTVSLSSLGTEPVAIATVSPVGADAAEFIVTEDKCSGTSLEPGQDCHVRVAFAPTVVGDKLAVLQVASDDQDDPAREIGLSGTAIGSATDGGTDSGTPPPGNGAEGDGDESSSGCSCRTQGPATNQSGWLLLLVSIVMWRRRRK